MVSNDKTFFSLCVGTCNFKLHQKVCLNKKQRNEIFFFLNIHKVYQQCSQATAVFGFPVIIRI